MSPNKIVIPDPREFEFDLAWEDHAKKIFCLNHQIIKLELEKFSTDSKPELLAIQAEIEALNEQIEEEVSKHENTRN